MIKAIIGFVIGANFGFVWGILMAFAKKGDAGNDDKQGMD